VLSTCPRPLAAVLARHGLGRFRVTQKARVDLPGDVYRGDGAAPHDWIMVGNHDTPPLALVIDRWQGTPELARRAAYLASRLATSDTERPALAEKLERDPAALALAITAELFLGPARHVQIFWPDLLGARDVYNQPGVVDDSNWSLRAPADLAAAHGDAVGRGDAPDLGAAVAWALRARHLDSDDRGRSMVATLAPVASG
jgi:4-alpha-glucanotransferase